MAPGRAIADKGNDRGAVSSMVGLIWKTHFMRYYHITLWAMALAVVTSWATAFLWYLATIAGACIRSVLEKKMQKKAQSGNLPASSHWAYPLIATFANSFWAVAPYLAWTGGHPYGEMLAVILLASGYMLVTTQFRGFPKYILLFGSPYTLVIVYLLALEVNAPIFWPFAVGLVALFSAKYFAIVYGSLAHRQIVEGQAAQDKLIKELEKARDEAEAANKAKSTFLAMISHELRTPMNGVLGAARLLARSDLNKDQRDHLYILEASSSSLMTLLNDILDFSKIEAERLTFERIEVDIKALLERLAGAWRGIAAEKGLTFDMAIPDTLPGRVMSDPTRISQILHNLLSNAVKYTPEGIVRFEAHVSDQNDRNIELTVHVKDSGPGIRRDDLQRLFQPFEQLDASRTRTHGGTGLGLAIARQLANNMGGDIRVESEEGKGSVFTVIFRFDVVDWATGAAGENAADVTGAVCAIPKRILVVEDHPLNCKLIESFLVPLGHRLTFANNGRQALEALRDTCFDVILMDVHMPKMDGLEATRLIRAGDSANAGRPIIMLSAGAMAEERKEGMKAGADTYVTKPIDPDELVAAIERFTEDKPGQPTRSEPETVGP